MSDFQLQLAKLPVKRGTMLLGLDFYLLDEEDQYDPVISSIPPVNYGELFAYLFRRFGYPVYGWDSYKDLVKYVLTTPRKDMWLRIIPYPDHNDLTFSFMVTESVRFSMRDWERSDINEWEKQRLAWYIERFGQPAWGDELCGQVGQEFGAKKPVAFEEAAAYLQMLYPRDKGEPKTAWHALAKEFFDSMKPFDAEHPRPAFRKRTRRIEDWREDDPLKPYAEAAVIALADLRRPVRVRDWAISAFGHCDGSDDELHEPVVAGYAAGALLNINHDPESAIEANRIIEKNGGLEWLQKVVGAASV